MPDLLFAPPTAEWHRLSPRYRTLRRLGVLLTWPWWVAGLAVLGWLFVALWVAIVIAVVGVLWIGWRWWRMGALVASWGYAKLADDLYVTRGLWFKRLTAVPYGRMQVVEVEAGPLDRAFKLATIKLVTASASTDATIPGLLPEEAARLRDRLTELGETRTSGL
ncbi:PH domain-containing protein [Ammonicoccus fulvus]|uniref:PH domain-containing protein n=1 Tax=Ammonicoccus fulvus TaxID=3138240 RepID=A0ABZ3FJM1_9ACTN